jgi:hypothetical protein
MMRNAGKLLIVAVALVSTSAWAGPLALWIGQTTFLGFPGRASQVEVSDPSVIAVQTSRNGAEIRAIRPGVSQVTLRLRDGETYEFAVHVTPRGAEVYSTARSEGEHSGFSLATASTASKSSAQARQARTDKAEKEETPRTAKRAVKVSRPRA